jgi:hypothetical protein
VVLLFLGTNKATSPTTWLPPLIVPEVFVVAFDTAGAELLLTGPLASPEVLVAVVLAGTEMLAAGVLVGKEVVPNAAAVVPASVLDFFFIGFFPLAAPEAAAAACAGAGAPEAAAPACAEVLCCEDCAAVLSYKC